MTSKLLAFILFLLFSCSTQKTAQVTNTSDGAAVPNLQKRDQSNTLKDNSRVLVFVDGKEIPYDEMKTLDPNLIESIDVIKNKESIKEYTSKDYNGVLLIHTKLAAPGPVVTTATGLKYRILKAGTGTEAKEGDEIMLRETTSYRNGTVLYTNFDSGGAVKVLIGGNQATAAVDEGLRGMKTGEIREIIAPPHLVKRTSYPPNVSPDSALVIKMKLEQILKK